jgi:hypothetical protein
MGSPYSMTLRRDKRSGSWRDRIRLPEDVKREYQALFDGPAWEEKFHRPAGTPRDKAVADHATWAAQIKGRIATIRARRVSKGVDLTEREAAVVAGDWYRWFVDQHSENPGRGHWAEQHEIWSNSLMDAADPEGGELDRRGGVRRFGWDELDAAEVESLYPALVHDAHVERFLADHGVVLSQAGRACFLSVVLRLFLDALGTLERRAAGNWSPDKRLEMLPSPVPIETLKRVNRRAGSKPMELFEAYCLDKQSAPSSVARRRIVFKTLDALREPIRDAEDAQRWLDSLKTKDRSAHTVRVTYLSAARAVYAWAKRKRLIAVNPFEDCVVEVPRKARTRATDKAFNDDEVSIILQAALQVEVRPGQPWDAAKRWVPCLSAYTGARAGELTQLRVKDIDAVRKAILITPDESSGSRGASAFSLGRDGLLELCTGHESRVEVR